MLCVLVLVSFITNFRAISSVKSQKVAVRDVELHCDITGSGNHTVLLLPGALGR